MTGKWADLAVRSGSGLAMLAVGVWAVWSGGAIFHAVTAIICGLMVWELTRMVAPSRGQVALLIGVLAGGIALLAGYMPPAFALPLLMLPAFAGLSQLNRYRSIFMIFVALVMLAGFGMTSLRDDFGWLWMLWLVLVVVVTDVMGYFAGRLFGGPRFWPRVSPKKTWAGTLGGWLGAALVGLGFMVVADAPVSLVAISVAVSMAAQMGDIFESATKRILGVKDSSALIPGHGGVLDRFDGMLGASVFVLLVGQAAGFPQAVP